MESFGTIIYLIHDYSHYATGTIGLASTFYSISVVNFVLSIILLFFGKRLLRLSLGIIGFILLGSIPYWICVINFYPYLSPSIILTIMVIFGLVAAFIVSYFTKFGIYIIGTASGIQFGYILWIFIYTNMYQKSIVLLIILTILFGLVGLILPFFFISYMAIIITAFNGSLLFRCVVQYLILAINTSHMWYSDHSYYSGINWGVLIGSLFLGCLGAFWQYRKYKDVPYLNTKSKQTPDEKC
jgi:hypothetical protein